MPATLFNATINGTAARLFSDVAWENGHRTLLPNVPLPENPMTVIEAVLAALSGLPANLAADDGDDFALVIDGAFSAAESLVPAPAAGHGGNGPAAGHVAGNGPAAGHVGNGQAPGLNNVIQPQPRLPPSRPGIDHEIITTDEEPTWNPIYALSPAELKALKDELDRLLELGFIKPSTSPYGTPVFFVKEATKIRLVFDFRKLNEKTIKNRTALPNMREVIDQLQGARYFTKLDLMAGFHQIRLAANATAKTAFRTKYGHFEWVVLPFGLCNAPATFQTLMNSIFRQEIDDHVVVYVDDVLIYSKTKEEHLRHVRGVFDKLKTNLLQVRMQKCEFGMEETKFLGWIVGRGKITADPRRVQAVLDWPLPSTTTQLHGFIGLANQLLTVIPNLARETAPLTLLLQGKPKKTDPITWTTESKEAFERAKKLCGSPVTLRMFNPEKETYLYTDWSNKAIGGWVGQPKEDGNKEKILRAEDLVPVAFHSRKLHGAELHYAPYDGELLSLVEHLEVF